MATMAEIESELRKRGITCKASSSNGRVSVTFSNAAPGKVLTTEIVGTGSDLDAAMRDALRQAGMLIKSESPPTDRGTSRYRG